MSRKFALYLPVYMLAMVVLAVVILVGSLLLLVPAMVNPHIYDRPRKAVMTRVMQTGTQMFIRQMSGGKKWVQPKSPPSVPESPESSAQ